MCILKRLQSNFCTHALNKYFIVMYNLKRLDYKKPNWRTEHRFIYPLNNFAFKLSVPFGFYYFRNVPGALRAKTLYHRLNRGQKHLCDLSIPA